ncbi:calcium/sodium antiporter [Nitrospina gracilis]|uniref:calcium/sodium antiporter n=1 Tax=Nitrospina gracilis TaxID=35801 RepID=UPI0023510FBF|nr:calcium/sodium antiporter [Nitrospina gracilis]
MIWPALAILGGLALLVWSADRFVEGAAASAQHFGLPPLLIGMVIVGFGTSAPEMTVSVLSAVQGNPGIALGNAYGSNITNIALILGLTALLKPIAVESGVLRRELPLLTGITALAVYQLVDGELTRLDAVVLLGVFAAVMGWTIREGLQKRKDALAVDMQKELVGMALPLGRALFWVVVGLILLIVSSRLLVWGAVEIAHSLGVSDLIIGLTVVAVGTSLPELASSLVAAWKGESDLALGNILGSNLFNTLAVVGLAGVVQPMPVAPEVVTRDCSVMGALTVSLFVIGYGFRDRPGSINRWEGGILLAVYLAYSAWLARLAVTGGG